MDNIKRVEIKSKSLKRWLKIISILLTCTCLIISIKTGRQKVYYDNTLIYDATVTAYLNDGNTVSQYFYADHDMHAAIRMCFYNEGQVNYDIDDMVIFQIFDENEVCLDERSFRPRNLANAAMCNYVVFEQADLEEGKWYRVDISTNFVRASNPLYMQLVYNDNASRAYMLMDGSVSPYNCKMIIGE